MAFKIIRNDITKIKADAIVNTANPYVEIGEGVDTAIYNAAGRERLLKERAKIGILKPGEVALTPAFDLPAKFIIHSSGPVWWDGTHHEERLLRQCYDKSLKLAWENNCTSIAFPLLATGAYGFPHDIGFQVAIDAFTCFLAEHEMDITLVVFTKEAYHISGSIFDDVKSYIDDNYVAEANVAQSFPGAFNRERAVLSKGICQEDELDDLKDLDKLEQLDSLNELIELEQIDGLDSPDELDDIERLEQLDELEDLDKLKKLENPGLMYEPVIKAATFAAPAMSLDDALKDIYTDSFEKHLQQMINKKGLKNSQVYADANISKQYFSKLMKGKVKPSKEKVLALAVGLHLNMDETVDFLSLAGYAISPISQTDVIVSYFIKIKQYNVIKIDCVLFDYGLPMLSE